MATNNPPSPGLDALGIQMPPAVPQMPVAGGRPTTWGASGAPKPAPSGPGQGPRVPAPGLNVQQDIPGFGNQVTGNTPLGMSLNLPRLTPQQAAQGLYMGEAPILRGPGVSYEPQFVDPAEAWKSYMTLPDAAKARLAKILDAKRGKGNWGMQEMDGLWSTGIQGSMYATQMTGERKTPLQVLEDFYLKGDTSILGPNGAGGGSSGGGGGGPTSNTNTSVSLQLTDPLTAEGLLDQTLSKYLGREANAKEKETFLSQLHANQLANPQTRVTQQTNSGGKASTSTDNSQTSGGTDPGQFAINFAQMQKGSSEHMAATTYMDAFMGALENPADVVR